jgi:hypothetical protein
VIEDMSDVNHYFDTSTEDAEDSEPVSNPGVKLWPNEHSRFYDDVRGMSEARPQTEKPKEPRRLSASVRACCDHPGTDRDEIWW